MNRYDLIVVGAGPGGCAAGIVAARSGARVLVIDRARFPRPKTCGDAVSNRGAELIDALGHAPRMLSTIPHAEVRGARAILPAGASIDRDFGGSPGFIVPRLHLDDLLRGQLERAGAEVREGVQAHHLEVQGESTCRIVTQRETLSSSAVIAADGPGSIAWSALGEPYRRGRKLAVAITAYYRNVAFEHEGAKTEHYFERDLPCGYAWVFPEVEGQCNVGVYQRVDHFKRAGRSLPELLERFVKRHPERFMSARRVGAPRVWSLPLANRMRPPAGPGLLTVGDAAGSIDPLSGEGIWQALATGQAAAQIWLEAGGKITAAQVRAYVRRWTALCGAISWVRWGVQEAMRVVVDHRLDQTAAVRAVLRRGYASEAFEASKRVGPRDSVAP